MMKIVVRLVLVLVVLLVAAVGAGMYFLGSIVKTSVESVGPQITKTAVRLDGATVSLLSGSGTLSGFFVGNPEGFKIESAIEVGSVSVSVEPRSVFSDRIHVKQVKVLAPEITFEGGLRSNNLGKLLDNVQATTGGAKKTATSDATVKKLQVDDLIVSDGQIKMSVDVGPLGGKSATVPLPPIHLTNLGSGPEGITPQELTSRVLKEILQEAVKASGKAMVDLGKGAAEAAGDAGKAAAEGMGKATKGLGGLIKR